MLKRLLAAFCLILFATLGQSQSIVALAPIPQFTSYLQNGSPNAFGCVFTNASGTTSPIASYTDFTGNTQNSNPVKLSAGGTANIWIQVGTVYSFNVTTAGAGDARCTGGSNVYTISGIGGGSTTQTTVVPYSATPAFPVTSQNQLFTITLTGNATSLPITIGSGVTAPAYVTFQITQDAVGGHSFLWPSNLIGGAPVAIGANQITTQEFMWNGTTVTALGPSIFGSGNVAVAGTLTALNFPDPYLIFPSVNGIAVENSPGTYIGAPSGTAVTGSLASLLNGGAGTAAITPAGATGNIAGIAVQVIGGSVNIQQSGSLFCPFDGAVTAPDYVQASPTIAGDCHDAGSTYPISGQVLGRALGSSASAGPALIDLFGPEIQANAGAACSNAALITVRANTTSYQPMVTCGFAAGSLNVLNKAIRLTFASTIAPASSITSNLGLAIGNSSSPTGAVPIATQISASTAWSSSVQLVCSVNVIGTGGSLTCSNFESLPAAGSPAPLGAFNVSIDLTQAVYVGSTCSFTSASTSNTCTTSGFLVEEVN
jgi:hypothetical protein